MTTTVVDDAPTATTPNMIRYNIEGDTTPSISTAITQADLVAACASGPLKQFLQGLSAAAFATLATAQAGSALQVTVTPVQGAVVPGPFGVVFASGTIAFTSGLVAGFAAVTLRFIQSDDR